MHRAVPLLGLILIFSVAGAAQQTPRVEVFGGYSHLFADVNNSKFNMNGFEVSAAENLNNWFGGVLDFGSYWGKNAGLNVNSQFISYGPRVALRKSKSVTPSAYALFGAYRGSAGYAGISQSDTHFGMAFGGAVDVRVNDRLAVRVVQADYLRTYFLNLTQNNVRVSAGLVFRFAHW